MNSIKLKELMRAENNTPISIIIRNTGPSKKFKGRELSLINTKLKRATVIQNRNSNVNLFI